MYSRVPELRADSLQSSRASSPQPPSSLPSDELHYAYSTTLRRHEEHYVPSMNGLESAQLHPFAHTTAPLTPSAHYATLSISSTVSQLSTSATTGLQSLKIQAIRELSGHNEFEVPAKDPLWKRFAAQFYESPLILLLLGSAAVSALVGNYDDAASIIAAIVIVVTVGFIQEQRSEKSLEALNKLVPHYCHLIRSLSHHPLTPSHSC